MAAAKVTATVTLPKVAFKTEPVSPRLVRSMPHPERASSLPIVSFAPDGRLIVCGYPSGVVQVLDPTSGKELRTIHTPRGYRGSFNYVQLSSDRRTLFVALDDSKFEPLRVGEKKTYFRRYSGAVRAYDLSTGKEKEPLQVEPRRGVVSLALSPDATKVATMELASGLTDDFDKLRALYLWDVPSRKAVKLRDGYGDLRFSPDGKTVFVTVSDSASQTAVTYAHAVATGTEVGKVESKDGPARPVSSPDGKHYASAAIDPVTKQLVVHLYDQALRRLRKLTADVRGEIPFGFVTFSPDGKRVAAATKATVCLWDLETGQFLKSWPLDTPGRVWRLTFDPEGRRLAASTWFIPPELKDARDEVVTPQDYPQPKVFLIDAAADRVECLVCPHGWWGQPAFSPDGKLLAVGGAGATHVFDVGKK